jgi:hypothetical protein
MAGEPNSDNDKPEPTKEISIEDYEKLKQESIQTLVDQAPDGNISKAYNFLLGMIGRRDDRKAPFPSIPNMKAIIADAQLNEKQLSKLKFALIPRVRSDFFI